MNNQLSWRANRATSTIFLASFLKVIPLLGAVITTTPGPVSLSATFQCISVRAKFSGDSNSNNSATVQFRRSGDSNWHNAYTPTFDRRTGTDSYINEARVSIVGLLPNTSYDVAITWYDPDGVLGNASVTNTVSTLSYAPPTGGSTITVTNDSSLLAALTSVTAGQTIHVIPGTYSPFTITRGGNPTAYITIEGDSGGGSVVLGTNVNQNISLRASYIVLRNFTFAPSDHSGLVFVNGLTGIYVQDCTMQNISTTCAANPTGNYSDCGINIAQGWSNIFILRNNIFSAALNNSACTLSPNYSSPGTGISYGAGQTLVVSSNIVVGGFRDAISQDTSGVLTENVDLYPGNFVSQYKDDGIESKGLNVNVRIGANWVTNDCGNTFFAGNENTVTNPYGPLYIFRNFGLTKPGNTNGAACYKLGTYCAPTFIFHNTLDCSAAAAAMDGVSPGSPVTAKNNILKTKGDGIIYAPGNSVFDFNLYYVTSGAYLVWRWNGATSYPMLTDFQTGTGQESHGLQADPILNADLSIPRNSPAVGVGGLLPNFNGSDSAWPPATNAPTIGSFEPNITLMLPPPPTGLRIIATQP